MFDGPGFRTPKIIRKGHRMQNPMQDAKAIFTRRESDARSYCRGFPKVFTRAVGSELFDDAGDRHIDFLAGCSSLITGTTTRT